MLYIKDNRKTVPIIVVEMWRLCRIYLLNECKNKISIIYIYIYIIIIIINYYTNVGL